MARPLTCEPTDERERTPITDGTIVNAKVVSIKEVEHTIKGEKVPRLEFKFQLITDDEHDGKPLWGHTGVRLTDHPDCRIRQWAEALLGTTIRPDFVIDLDDLEGRECRAVIEYRTWTSNEGKEKWKNAVRDVMPTQATLARMASALDDEDF